MSNLTATITADVGGLVANMEIAKAKLRDFQAEMRKTATESVRSGSEMDQATKESLTNLGAQAQATKAQIADFGKQVSSQFQKAAEGIHANTGAIREVIVELHELVTGRFSRMGGSALVLVERMGNLQAVVSGLTGPFGIAAAAAVGLGIALYEIVSKANAAEAALRGVYNAALMMGGVSAGAARISAEAIRNAQENSGVMSTDAINAFTRGMAQLSDMTNEQRTQLGALGPALTVLTRDAKDQGEEIEKYVANFRDVSSISSFAEKQGLVTVAMAKQFEVAKQSGNLDALRGMVLDTLTKRFSGLGRSIQESDQWMEKFNAAGGNMSGLASVPTPSGIAPNQIPETPAGARPAALQAEIRQTEEYNRVGLARARIESDITDMVKKRAAATTDAARAQYDAMIAAAQTELTQLKAPGAGSALDEFRAQLAEAKERAAAQGGNSQQIRQRELTAEIDMLRKEVDNEKLTAKERLSIRADLATKIAELDSAKAPRAGAAGGAARADYQAFAKEEEDKLSAARGNWTEQSALIEQWRAKAAASFAAGSTQFRSAMAQIQKAAQTAYAEIFRAKEASASQMEARDRSMKSAFESNMKILVAQHKITADQEFGFDAQYSDKLYDEERKRLEQMMADDRLTLAEKETLYDKLLQLNTSHNAKIAQDDERAAQKAKQVLDSYLNPLKSATVSGIEGLLNRTKTPAQAAAGVGTAALDTVFSKLGDVLFNKLGQLITNVLPDAFKTALGIGTATAETTAIVGAITTQAGMEDIALGTANLWLTAINAGIIALNAKPSVLGTTYSQGGIVPSAAGGWTVPSFAGGGILSILHQREMVLPRNISEFVQDSAASYAGGGGGGGGGSPFHLHVHAPDGPAAHRFLINNMHSIHEAYHKAARNGAMRPR